MEENLIMAVGYNLQRVYKVMILYAPVKHQQLKEIKHTS